MTSEFVARALCLATAALAFGCGPDGEDPVQEEATQAVELVELSTQESALFFGVSRALDGPLGSEAQLRAAVTRAQVQQRELYGACVSFPDNPLAPPNSLTVTFAQCSGRLGLRVLTGTLQFTFVNSAGGLIVNALLPPSAAPFRVNDSSLSRFESRALLRATSEGYIVTTTRSLYQGTNTRGLSFRRDSEEPVVSSVQTRALCYSLDGGWTVAYGATRGVARSVRVEVRGYRRCLGGCPDPAENAVTTTTTGADGRISEWRLTFRGGRIARWQRTSPSASGTLTLMCSNQQ